MTPSINNTTRQDKQQNQLKKLFTSKTRRMFFRKKYLLCQKKTKQIDLYFSIKKPGSST